MLSLRILRAFLFLFISFLVPAAALAQDVTSGYVHQQWTAREGLPVDGLNDVLQTRDGYLWIATWDGLVRFDGVRFVTFNVGNTDALPSNRITHLFELPDGRLRVLTTLPASVVDYQGGHFSRSPSGIPGAPAVIRAVVVDPDGTFWLGSDAGLYRLAASGSEPPRFVVSGNITSLVRDAAGALWVARRDGGGLVELRNGELRHWSIGEAAGSNQIWSIEDDADGTLWIGTSAGLYRLRAGRISAVPTSTGRRLAIVRLERDGAGTLWVWTAGTDMPSRVVGERVVTADPARASLQPDPVLQPGAHAADGWRVVGSSVLRGGREVFRTPSQIVRHLQDREGSLWLATFNSGLHRLRRAEVTTVELPGRARERRSHSVLEDASGTIWIGSPEGGIFRRDGERLTRVTHVGSYDWLSRDASGRVRIGLKLIAGGAGHGDAGAVQVVEPNDFLGMYQDRTGAQWFPGSGGGISRYAPSGWRRFAEADGFPVHPVRAVHETRDGAIWFLTEGGGVARYGGDRVERLTTAHGLASDFVRGFHEDADGILWIGGVGRGLNRVDARGADSLAAARVTVIRTRHGLADDVVHQILEDDAGRLWIGSNRGIFSVRRADLNAFAEGRIQKIHSVQYDESHGMRSREVNGGGSPSGLRSRDGRLWFPTQDGVAVIDPASLAAGATLTVLVETRAVGDSILPLFGELSLAPSQRDFEISYTSPSFVSPAHLRFRYRLDGLHSDWIEAGTRRTAFFTNLPPGRYTFRVAVTRGDGTWTEAEAPLPILVEPRAHETGWFRVLLALALVLAAAGLWSWRARLLRERARELERIVWERTAELEHEKEITARQASALAELDRAKGRFFANISHEFRTPLTLILGPLRDLTVGRHGLLPAAVHAQHEMMLRNARRLLRLINQVLDLARLESGGLTLDAAPRDLVELALATTRSFTPLAERRGIALAFHAEEDRLVTNLEAEQIEKVLLNLLSNAFKFTEPGGRVEVTAAAQGGGAVIEVRDTGVGIEPGQLQRVFDRFYQADTSATRRHEGSGIGLSLAKELVELHGGTLSARSQPGEGSTFTIRLPLLAAAEAGDTHPGRDGTSRAWVPLDSSMRIRNRDAGAAHPLVERELHANGGDPVEAAVREPDDADRTTVLVVDDNADIRAYVRVVLTPGFRVVEAADGEEGLERAREALPDLVLADVMMPRLDGIGLARALRGDPATDCIPVILLTARAEAGHEVEGLGAGADDYITKPFDSSVLEARVANLIASRRRLRERFRQEGVPAPTAASAEAAPARSEMEEQLRAAVEANLTDPDFNPEALADAADLSYQQLYRRLREELDATPSQFIRTVRVERAAELLRDGAGSVTEVAYSVGFNSLSHFNRCFRERFGAAPSESLGTRA